eukprot:scaffold2617_cov328-Prasinococcus_capsulatus_cf.AAC.1
MRPATPTPANQLTLAMRRARRRSCSPPGVALHSTYGASAGGCSRPPPVYVGKRVRTSPIPYQTGPAQGQPGMGPMHA